MTGKETTKDEAFHQKDFIYEKILPNTLQIMFHYNNHWVSVGKDMKVRY